MVNRRKNRQKILMTDELFDKIGHEYKEDKPINTSIYKPVEEKDSLNELLESVSDFEETQQTTEAVSSKKPRGVKVLMTCFILISLLSIATIVFILVRGGV